MGYNIIKYKYIQRHRKGKGKRGYGGEREPVVIVDFTVGIAWVLFGVVKGKCL